MEKILRCVKNFACGCLGAITNKEKGNLGVSIPSFNFAIIHTERLHNVNLHFFLILAICNEIRVSIITVYIRHLHVLENSGVRLKSN